MEFKTIEILYARTQIDFAKLQKEALDHYDRMIAWAETQDKDIKVNSIRMNIALGELWGGLDCAYCRLFWAGLNCRTGEIMCPLKKRGGYRMNDCCNGLWDKLNKHSDTWEEWIANAKKVRIYIKRNGIPKKEEV